LKCCSLCQEIESKLILQLEAVFNFAEGRYKQL
jgi:hypothetical protein